MKRPEGQAPADNVKPHIGWRVLRIGWFGILLAASSGAQTQMANYTIQNDLEREGFVIEKPDSPEFKADLAKLFTPDELGRVSSFLPYSIILVNRTGRYVWGFTVVYNYPDNIAPSGNHWRYRINRSAQGPVDLKSMMPPGAKYLITPVAPITGSIDDTGRVSIKPPVDEDLGIFVSKFESMHQGRMELLIDSLIYDDGILVGPDTQGTLLAVNEQIRADKDLADAVKGHRGAELRSLLDQHSARSRVGEYGTRYVESAELLRNGLSSRGEEWVLDNIDHLRTVKWFGENDGVKRRKQ